jgi:hypothetical protein
VREPFTIFADFESFTDELNTCDNDPEKSYAQKLQKQVPSSFVFYLVTTTKEWFELITYIANADEDVAEIFNKKLIEYSKMIYDKYDKNKKDMIFTDEDKIEYDKAKVCHIREHNFILQDTIEDEVMYEAYKDHQKVRDHWHITSKFTGAAHMSCIWTIMYQNSNQWSYIIWLGMMHTCPWRSWVVVSTVFLESMRCAHGIWRKMRKVINVLSRDTYGLVDSFKFMSSSLDLIVEECQEPSQSQQILHFTLGQCSWTSEWATSAFSKEGCLPLWICWFSWTFQWDPTPPEEAFYSQLNDSGISEKEYAHAQKIWEVFWCKTFRNYHDLYSKADVLQLADIFENFWDICMKNYKLDPLWYYTALGLAWNACLKLTEISLEKPHKTRLWCDLDDQSRN